MATSEEEIAHLQAEIENERALRAEAEAEADLWRQRTIDVKLDSIHKRREASAAIEGIGVDSMTNRSVSTDDGATNRLLKEVESLKEQRELLLKTLEDMQISEEENEEDKNLSPEERLEKERERRRAAEGLAKTLRKMFDDSETSRADYQDDIAKLMADNERLRKLLGATEDIMVQNRLGSSATQSTRSSVKRITAGGEADSSHNIIICIGVVAAVVAVAAVVYRRKKH